jgi:hypothetical protein
VEYNHHRIEVEGVEICFIEESYDVTMRVEGELPLFKVEKILSDIGTDLGALEKTNYTHRQIS